VRFLISGLFFADLAALPTVLTAARAARAAGKTSGDASTWSISAACRCPVPAVRLGATARSDRSIVVEQLKETLGVLAIEIELV
jgi:hypothetical protein